MWWNFVARTRDEIDAAYDDWRNETERFPAVASQLARIDSPRPCLAAGNVTAAPWSAQPTTVPHVRSGARTSMAVRRGGRTRTSVDGRRVLVVASRRRGPAPPAASKVVAESPSSLVNPFMGTGVGGKAVGQHQYVARR